MTTIFTILIVIASLVLILVVLVQKSKGGGLSSNFASSNAIMGVRKTTDVIEKVTWGLVSFIMVASIICVMFRPQGTASDMPKVGAPVPVQESGLPNMGGTGLPATTPAPEAVPTAPQQQVPAPAPAN